MGRPRKEIDELNLLAMRGEGKKLKEISKEMAVSMTTLTRRLATLHHEKGILTKYRQLQGLQLTELQAGILEAVYEKSNENDSLIELIQAFNVLKKAENYIQGKESMKIRGLLDHLRILEGQD